MRKYFILLMLLSCFVFSYAQDMPKGNLKLDSVKPGEDFFKYVNQKWMLENPIPPEKSRWGAFDEVRELTLSNLKAIVDEFERTDNLVRGTPEQKIHDFFKLGMDTVTINFQKTDPLKNEFEMIESCRTITDIQNVFAYLRTIGVSNVFYLFASPDPDNSSVYMARIWQDGLGLPNKDYYTKTDQKSKETLEAYKNHIKNMFALLGYDESSASKNAEIIMSIEMKIAEVSNTQVENTDPLTTNNKMTLEEMKKISPYVEWDKYLDRIGYPSIKNFNVSQPKFITGISNLLETMPVDEWKIYLKWKLIDDAAPYISSDFAEEHFNFFSRTLRGQQKPEQRWKQVLNMVNGSLGELLGQIYVRKHFSPEAKQRMLELVENLRKSFNQIIENLSWMTQETKKNALEKLDAMGVKIGYPDKWKDFSGLEIKNDSYIQNIIRARNFNFKYGNSGMEKVGKPVDRTIWFIPPQTVNAFYDPTKNEIVFPAGILQPPFFDIVAEDAVNYGAIGMVIGHEMTHGFDNSGRHYDKDGNLKEWWTEKDDKEFKERTNILVEQFNKYEALPETYLNGELTLGENIADLGGLNIALLAYKFSCETNKKYKYDNESLRKFFISYSSAWRQNIRDEALRVQVKTDPHSPARFRVNGPLFNINEFYRVFPEIKPDDKLYRPESIRPVIWGY